MNSELKCYICGSNVTVQYPVRAINESRNRLHACRPTHKNNRIQKKWQKHWKSLCDTVNTLVMIPILFRHPSFRCDCCDKSFGYYDTIGRNLFSVQPMDLPVASALYQNDTFGGTDE